MVFSGIRELVQARIVSAGFAFERLAGVRSLDVFDGRAFGAFVEFDVFTAKGDVFAERVADPVVGEEKTFVFAGAVAFEDDSVQVLDFPLGVFGTEEEMDESGDGLAVVHAYFKKHARVVLGAVEVVDDFEPFGEIPFVLPLEVVDAEAFDIVVVCKFRVVLEGGYGIGDSVGLDAEVGFAAKFFARSDDVATGGLDDFGLVARDSGYRVGARHLAGLQGRGFLGCSGIDDRLAVLKFFRSE